MYYRVVRILFWLGLGIVIGSAASGFVGLIGGVLVGFTLGTAMVKTFREMRAEAKPYGGIKANYSQKAKQRQFRQPYRRALLWLCSHDERPSCCQKAAAMSGIEIVLVAIIVVELFTLMIQRRNAKLITKIDSHVKNFRTPPQSRRR